MPTYEQAKKFPVGENPSESAIAANKARFSKALDLQSELIAKIEDKLHELLNKRTPEKGQDLPERLMADFVGYMGGSIDRLEGNNSWLEKLLEHLRQII